MRGAFQYVFRHESTTSLWWKSVCHRALSQHSDKDVHEPFTDLWRQLRLASLLGACPVLALLALDRRDGRRGRGRRHRLHHGARSIFWQVLLELNYWWVPNILWYHSYNLPILGLDCIELARRKYLDLIWGAVDALAAAFRCASVLWLSGRICKYFDANASKFDERVGVPTGERNREASGASLPPLGRNLRAVNQESRQCTNIITCGIYNNNNYNKWSEWKLTKSK